MWSRIIIYIVGVITGHCYGEKVYTNHCGTVSVAEPAIHGKRVLFTFIPKNQTNISEGGVTWIYYDDHEYEATESTRYNMLVHTTSFTLDLGCSKDEDRRREYSAEYSFSTGGCRSSWFKLTVLDAPTNCGILYRQPKRIQNVNEVIMEYYAPDSVLEDSQYVRHLRRKNLTDCDNALGCAVDVTWFEEEYSEYNSVYAYRIRNFTEEMKGNYTLQCTNGTNDYNITNYVRLFIPVAPQIPTLLNTKNIDGNENCIAVKENKDATVQCDVEGGTFPMYVKMSIVGVADKKECTINKENVICEWGMNSAKDYHLVGIQCEVSNEATVQPIATTAKLYVVTQPTGPFLHNPQQTEGRDMGIECDSQGGRPTPELSMLVNDTETNSSLVPVRSSYLRIKLNHLNRNWNRASLKCCMQHLYYDEPKCSDSKQVIYRYAPFVSTNASKDTIWNVGDTVMIKCYADSFPSANLSWFDTDNNTMATSNCGDNAICMEIKNVQMTDAGIYTCIAETELFDTEIQTVELAIKSTNAIKQGHDKEKTTTPWFIVGIAASILIVVLAVIIAVVLVTKRRKRRQIKKATENVSMDVLSHDSKHCGENIGSDIGTHDRSQDMTNANATGDRNPTNTDCPRTDDGAEYAVAIPKSQRQKQGVMDIDTSSIIKQDNHNLVYADLDLITDGTTTNTFVQSNELTTEYVSIDFNRVGEQLPDVETENIYANQ